MVSISHPRVAIFGLDGGTFDVIRPLVAAGRLPVLGRLMGEGSHGVLQSTLPPITPTGWTSFMTGKHPRSHGVFEFERFMPGSYATQPISAGMHGHHTLWRIVSEQGKRVIALDVPFTFPPEPVNGCLIAGYGVPTGDGTIFTYPAGLRAELQRAIGACDPAVIDELPSPRPELFRAWDRILDNRERIARYLMARDDWELFMLVFGVIDNIQHALWNYIDPLHPNYYARVAPAYRETLFRYYERVDAMMGRLLAEAGETCHVVVMSDHGFGSTRPGLFMSSFLVENGWLRYRGTAARGWQGGGLMKRALRVYNSSPALRAWLRSLSRPAMEKVRGVLRRGGVLPALANVDWDGTRVFSTRFGMNLYVNAVGKFPQGMVTTEEYENLCGEVTSRLLALRLPGGGAVVRNVHRVAAGQTDGIVAPDMIVEYNNFYDAQTVPDRRRVIQGLDGSHVAAGVLVLHGRHVRAGPLPAETSIVDVAPTVLRLMGVPVPQDMDGRVISEALTSEAGEAQEGAIAYSAPDNMAQGYSPGERVQVEEQLRMLGYIE